VKGSDAGDVTADDQLAEKPLVHAVRRPAGALPCRPGPRDGAVAQPSPGTSQLRLEWSRERCTADGMLHGGALMSLANATPPRLPESRFSAGMIAISLISRRADDQRGEPPTAST
jgi:hypothetical protein